MKKISLFLLTLPLATLATLAPLAIAVAQQVTSDGTVSTTVIPSPDGKNFDINDGTRSGGNLFHSFKEFSVPTRGSANFNNALDIQNIIGRVTGGSVSNIDGLIRTLGKANLFLLNPAGIIFGPNASLQIGGSFLGSTANSLLFKDGFEFSATNPQAAPLLTINVPIGLGFRNNPQNITSQSAGLEVPQGNYLALVGGNVSLNGGILFAPAGRVELGGLSAAGTVGLNGDGSLSFPVGVQRADVSLTNRAIAYVSAGGGGNIAVNARNLELSGGSILGAGIQSGLGTPGAQAGDIKIDAKDTVSLDGSGVANFVQEGGLGNAGNIQITTQNLTLKNRAVLSTGTSGTGNGGILTINAKGSISLDNSPIRSSVESTGVGNAGDINITTGSLILKNGAQITGSTFGTGNGGIVKINASDTISLDGQNSSGTYSAIGSRVEPDAIKGDAGSVQITTKDLTLGNENFVSADTLSEGNAGSVVINASGSVVVDGGYIRSSVQRTGVGNAGGIDITTGSLVLKNGSQIIGGTFGTGNGGIIKINANDTITVDGRNSGGAYSAIGSRVEPSATKGDAGSVQITTKDLTLGNGNFVSAKTFSLGNAGSVEINAKGSVLVDGGEISSTVEEKGVGNAGGVQLTTTNLTLKNGAVVSTNTFGEGSAGNVFIKASNASLEGNFSLGGNNTGISARVREDATKAISPGNISIITDKLSLTNGAQVGASTAGQGDAGNIVITAGEISFAGIATNGQDNYPSGVFSTVRETGRGNGGEIRISADKLSLTDGARLSASTSGQGNAGKVTLEIRNGVTIAGVNDGTSSGIFSNVNTGGVGNAGGVEITTDKLSLKDGAQLSTNTLGEGSAGSVFIKASNVSLEGNISFGGNNTGISARVREDATKAISPGNISIITDKLSLTNGAQVGASTAGEGNAGNIVINAGEVSFAGIATDGKDTYASGIFSTVRETGRGNGGEIRITTDKLSLTDGALFSTSTSGQGNGGNITINATDTVSLAGDGTLVISDVNPVDAEQIKRNGGNISLTTDKLSLTNGAQLSASTGGLGDAGNVIVSAREVSFAGISSDGQDNYPSGIFSRVQDTGIGNGGEIRISADKLSLTDGALLSTSTYGQGNAGKVKLEIRNGITITGVNDGTRSGIFSNVNTGAVGNAGGIEINARSLSLTNGGTISSTNFSNGTAGNIIVTTAKDIRLDNKASIEANTRRGEGNITLNSGDLILRRNSSITTNATGTATGGNITINTGNLVALENSKITANAEKGYGGNIFITTTGGRFLSPDSVISATSEAGPQFNGIVQFNTQLTDPTRGLFELSEAVIDPAQQVAQNPCSKGFGSSFTITGRGGLPTDPQKVLSSNNVRVDLIQPVTRTVNSTSTTYKQPSQKPPLKKIVPVQGWIYNEKGEVVLVGYDPTKVGVQREQPAPNSSCAAVK